MVNCEYPTFITTNTTLTTDYNTYIVTPSTELTLTLPNIQATGVSFKIRRGGANFGLKVTLSASGGDVINYDGANSATYPINPLNFVEVIYNGNGTWYLSKLIMSDTSISSGIITTNFIENSSSPYFSLTNSSYPVSYTYHKFSTRGYPNYIAVSTTHVNGTCIGTLNVITGTTTHMSLSITVSSAGLYEFFSSTILSAFPTTDSIVQIRWVTSPTAPGNYKVGLNAIYLF